MHEFDPYTFVKPKAPMFKVLKPHGTFLISLFLFVPWVGKH